MNTSNKFHLNSTQSNFGKKKALSTSLSTGSFPMISTFSNKALNIKTFKVTDMYKNLYHKDTGKVMNSLLIEKQVSKNDADEMNANNYDENTPQRKVSLGIYPIKKVRSDILRSEIEPFNHTSPKFKSSSKNSFKFQSTSNVIRNFGYRRDVISESNSFMGSSEKFNLSPKKTTVFSDSRKFFCPFCEHCNKINDNYLDNYLCTIKETKNIINKGFDFIIHSDFLSNTEIFKDNQNNNTSGKTHPFKFEEIMSNFPKTNVTNRLSYQVLAHFLEALVENKTCLENIASTDVIEKFKDCLISKGQAYDENSEKIEFDKELESLFDDNTKQMLENLIKKKHINADTNFRRFNSYNSKLKNTGSSIFEDFRKTNKSKVSDNRSEEDTYQVNKKFLILFLIFLQILSEISVECKERAVLLYKFFKLYFVELEKKWTSSYERLREKIKYYKELCKAVIQQKNKFLEKIEMINNIIFSNNLTSENLIQHKKLIQDLLGIIKEKREEIYLLKSNVEIIEKEMKFWIYDFESIKLSKEIKNKMISVNIEKLVKNINDEMGHKSITKAEKSILINADRFLMISGQRGYFYEQKNFFQQEVERLNEMFKKNYYKRQKWKNKYYELNNELIQTKNKLEKEIESLREKLMIEKTNVDVQTDIDFYSYNKMLMNHELFNFSRRLTQNKLCDFIDRITYGCSKSQPISKRSLLNLIPEIYDEKINLDSKMDLENKRRLEVHVFFLKFMEDKFKFKKVVKKNCEQTIISVLKGG